MSARSSLILIAAVLFVAGCVSERPQAGREVAPVSAAEAGSGGPGGGSRAVAVQAQAGLPKRAAGERALALDARASAGGNGATAHEVADGSDDNVVARRLRKAAEQETDPQLKDKLWQEYLSYKNNAQGQ